MKVNLMYKDRAFDLGQNVPWNGLDLIQDLQLDPVLSTMAVGDDFLYQVAKSALLSSLENGHDTILYRQAILKDCLEQTTPYLRQIDITPIVERTEGFTGADIKRIVADAINLYGYELAKAQEPGEPLAYFEQAIEQLATHRERLETAPPATSPHHGAASRQQHGFAAAMAAMQQAQRKMDSDML